MENEHIDDLEDNKPAGAQSLKEMAGSSHPFISSTMSRFFDTDHLTVKSENCTTVETKEFVQVVNE